MIFTELLLWGFRVIVETKNNPVHAGRAGDF